MYKFLCLMFYSEAPFHEAAYFGKIGILKLLLEAEIQVDSLSIWDNEEYFCTPLQWAIVNNQPESVQLLLQFGANPEVHGQGKLQ